MIQNSYYETSEKDIYPLLAFKRSPGTNITLPDTRNKFDVEDETERDHLIICKFCNHFITHRNNVIDINGSHTHICTNPAGNTYRIRCFSDAAGCLSIGESTDEFTWFPGFIWNYAICSLCHNHLGWFYQSELKNFYGLILDNLIENI
ncbi:MAG: hypothetical protein JW864_14855 [Spirochaetes bacterium]|nr:hypothetical protein [Spirochaetota bacterium]